MLPELLVHLSLNSSKTASTGITAEDMQLLVMLGVRVMSYDKKMANVLLVCIVQAYDCNGTACLLEAISNC